MRMHGFSIRLKFYELHFGYKARHKRRSLSNMVSPLLCGDSSLLAF